MRFWIECTRFATGQAIHIVGGDGQTIEVSETPEQILERHLGAMRTA